MKLYKYVSARGLDLLTARRALFTSPCEFNDPFDFAPSLEAIAPSSQMEQIFRQEYGEDARAWFESEIKPKLLQQDQHRNADELTLEQAKG